MASGTRAAVRQAKTQAAYWRTQDATVDGMLGGYAVLDAPDVAASRAFLDEAMPAKARQGSRVLDCGAGIGRVTKHLLLPAGFATADLLDISADFLAAADAYVGTEAAAALGEKYCASLAEFDFGAGASRRWRCIWVQWCIIYLFEDEDFVNFFRRAAEALDGDKACIIVKENTLTRDAEPEVDHRDWWVTRRRRLLEMSSDFTCGLTLSLRLSLSLSLSLPPSSSITRSTNHLRRLFAQAGLDLFLCKRQEKFPKDLYPVYMFALRPKQQQQPKS